MIGLITYYSLLTPAMGCRLHSLTSSGGSGERSPFIKQKKTIILLREYSSKGPLRRNEGRRIYIFMKKEPPIPQGGFEAPLPCKYSPIYSPCSSVTICSKVGKARK